MLADTRSSAGRPEPAISVASSEAICTRVAMAEASTASSWVTHGSRNSRR